MKNDYLADTQRNDEFRELVKKWKESFAEGAAALQEAAEKIVDYDFNFPYSRLAEIFCSFDYEGIKHKSLTDIEKEGLDDKEGDSTEISSSQLEEVIDESHDDAGGASFETGVYKRELSQIDVADKQHQEEKFDFSYEDLRDSRIREVKCALEHSYFRVRRQ